LASDFVGRRLGQYQIVQQIGRGGMAVVYRAYQQALERHVAIKMLPRELSFDRGFVERFLREARAAARLVHPNIVTIHDVGQVDGVYFIVMELVGGPSLASLLQSRGALSPAQVAKVISQMASALDYAHQRGFVHRDIKPANILLTADGTAKLTDFGIVKPSEGTRLTQTGMLLGTPAYMSPEQAKGATIGKDTDIYSLAVVTYEMLSGRVPFSGSTMAVLHAHAYEPPDLSTLPATLQAVVGRGLAKDPAARYASAGEFAQALQKSLEAKPAAVPRPRRPPSPPPVQKRRRRSTPIWVWALGAVVILLVVGLGIGLAMLAGSRAAPTPPPTAGPSPTLPPTFTALPVTAPPTPTEPVDVSEAAVQSVDPPASVVDDFVRATLGSVPGAAVDYDKARTLMTADYAAEFDSPEFVPQAYGIQDGPDSYEIAAEDVSGSTATVLVLGFWGADPQREWYFALEQQGALWRIAAIDTLPLTEPAGQEEPSATPTEPADQEEPTATPTPPPTEDEADQPALDPPAAVVDTFVRSTLGTVPGAAVDHDRARTLMTADYAAEFDSPEFVPLAYGIQDGPTSYEIVSEDISGSSATVLVLGYWGGDLGRRWSFGLEQEDGAWKVFGIAILDTIETAEEEEAPSPFWELNPVATEFTVYEHGGWKLVVTFDEAPQDTRAQLRIEYWRDDDGSLAYVQEDSGVIAAGGARLKLDSDWTGYDLAQMGFKPGQHTVIAMIDGVAIAEGTFVY
jgi:serine/threonine-protein kinase